MLLAVNDLNIGLLSGVLGGLLAAAGLQFVRHAGGPARWLDGALVLTRTRLYKGISVSITILFMPLAVWAVFAAPWVSATDRRYGQALFALVALLALMMVASTFYRRIVVSDKGITSRSPWTGTRFVAWSDIKDVRYVPIFQWLCLHGSSTGPVRIDLMFAGLPDFIDVASQHLSPRLSEGAVAAFRARFSR